MKQTWQERFLFLWEKSIKAKEKERFF